MKNYLAGIIAGLLILCPAVSCKSQKNIKRMTENGNSPVEEIRIFLCGDVMTGRGIDQALPHPVKPVLYESWVKDARDYLKLAQQESGDIDVPVSYDYIWGDAMEVWAEKPPQLKLINLETSITTHDEPWPGKGINYRMHPDNIDVLTVAGIDHCSLANNHTLDWGRPGMKETMQTLDAANIKFSGVGDNQDEAARPSVLEVEQGRVLVFSYGSPGSGIPATWAAEGGLSGLNFLPGLDSVEIKAVKQQVDAHKKEGDIAVFSIHWGGNWGYDISRQHQEFAHLLIDEAGIDIIYGHSSHHPLGIEVYNEKLIIYGAGDFINDYEGISGHDEYRSELCFMYFPSVDQANGKLRSLELVPMEMRKFRLNRASPGDTRWLQETMNRENRILGTALQAGRDNSLWLEW